MRNIRVTLNWHCYPVIKSKETTKVYNTSFFFFFTHQKPFIRMLTIFFPTVSSLCYAPFQCLSIFFSFWRLEFANHNFCLPYFLSFFIFYRFFIFFIVFIFIFHHCFFILYYFSSFLYFSSFFLSFIIFHHFINFHHFFLFYIIFYFLSCHMTTESYLVFIFAVSYSMLYELYINIYTLILIV